MDKAYWRPAMKTITIHMKEDEGRYAINAKGFSLSDKGMMEALWLMKDAQGTLEAAFKDELKKQAKDIENSPAAKRKDTRTVHNILKDLAPEDIEWLKRFDK